MDKKMNLGYTNKFIEGRIRLSPSSMFNYYNDSNKWYRQAVLGEKSRTNENLLAGTLIHNRIECYYNNIDIDLVAEIEYLDTQKGDLVIHTADIIDVVDNTYKYLVEEYLPSTKTPDEMETWLEFVPEDRILWLSGTFDYRIGSKLGDYKTCNSKPNGMSVSHRIQLYLYAWLLRHRGTEIDEIEVTYIKKWKKGTVSLKTGKEGKPSEPEVYLYREPIDEDYMNEIFNDIKMIEQKLKLIQDGMDWNLFFPQNRLSIF